MRPQVTIGLLGTVLDKTGQRADRWQRWRPTISLCQQEDLLIHRFELLFQAKYQAVAEQVIADMALVAPETEVCPHFIEFDDPWDFEQVYAALHDFARNYPFNSDKEDYLVHITTGTHVAQICCYLLTEARYFPARLIQTSPPKRRQQESLGSYRIIDLDLSRYDHIAQRFQREADEGTDFLKAGIQTRDQTFNALITRIEQVAIRSKAPLLLTGPTGAGKSQLARRIFELKRRRNQVTGPFVEVNCATLRGDAAMSALFGHVKGAFTGANKERTGLLRSADQGLLFLDEIGELGLDEQTMLLRALEEKRFLPMGADQETTSEFQLIGGTNRNLAEEVQAGRFREDLLARINLWHFHLPGLKDRQQDIEPNLDFELERYAQESNHRVAFNKEARQRYLTFSLSAEAEWRANFRDLTASVTRLATLASGGRITVALVEEEIQRLRDNWQGLGNNQNDHLNDLLTIEIDRFDYVQLQDVVSVCRASRSLSEAGRKLYSVSRQSKRQPNDADRLRKYLGKFNLNWQDINKTI